MCNYVLVDLSLLYMGEMSLINKKIHLGGGKLEKPCWYMELNKLR